MRELTPSMTPDIALAAQFLQKRGPASDVLQCGITGSHIYGFPSADSDLDLKGIHIVDTAKLLTLHPETPAFDRLEVFNGVECDLTTNEIAHALSMLLKGNGNVLERILSEYQLIHSSDVETLQQLARGSIHRGFCRHYRGYFHGMQREHGLKGRAKTALYVYRVALTGEHLLRTGDLVTDVRPLAEEADMPLVAELVAFKNSTAEKVQLPEPMTLATQQDWVRLEEMLLSSYENSSLPETPPNGTDIESWLLSLRKARL